MEKTKQEMIMAAKQEMVKIAHDLANAPLATAKLVGSPYDPVMPVEDVIGMIMNTDIVGPGEDFDYFVVDEDVKQVYTLSGDCNVTSVAVTPQTELTLTFAEHTSPEFFICIKNLLDAKYDVLARKRDNIRRALDNSDVKLVMDLLEAAVPAGNEHTLATGDEKFNYQDLCAMVEDVANYGTKLVLIAGTSINKDIILWNFDNDKNKPISVEDFQVELKVIRGTVKIDAGSVEPILDPDTAYLVATSDSEGNKPGYFVRRRVSNLGLENEGERLVLPTSPVMAIGSNRKLAFAVVGYEQIGAVITNPNTISKFTRVVA